MTTTITADLSTGSFTATTTGSDTSTSTARNTDLDSTASSAATGSDTFSVTRVGNLAQQVDEVLPTC